jgi:ABC-type Zn uptake system ZnuABC Zn-binding protein ZnuA
VSLIKVMRGEKASMLFVEDFYNKATAQLVAEKAGAKLLVLPTDVGATPQLKTWFDLVDAVLKEIAAAL